MNTSIFNTIATDLYAAYGHRVSLEEITAMVRDTEARHRREATIDEFIPILVEREVTETIEKRLGGKAPRLRVVFVDRADRSVAEAAAGFANNIAGGVALASSANTHPENSGSAQLAAELRSRGIEVDTAPVGEQLGRTLSIPDVAVYMNPGETHDVPAMRELTWDFPSARGMSYEAIETLADDIRSSVAELVGRGDRVKVAA